MDCYVAIGRLGYVGVELHGQAGGGMAEPGLDHPGVLSLFDHQAGGDVAQTVEGEAATWRRPWKVRSAANPALMTAGLNTRSSK
jgi:hypothetical protein